MIETRESIHLVLEYAAGGTLQQLVAARGRLSEEEARPLLTLALTLTVALTVALTLPLPLTLNP